MPANRVFVPEAAELADVDEANSSGGGSGEFVMRRVRLIPAVAADDGGPLLARAPSGLEFNFSAFVREFVWFFSSQS